MERTMANFEKLIEKAEARNIKMSDAEKEHGFATPQDAPIKSHAATALAAIEAGIRLNDMETVAEGYVILRDLVKRL